MKNIIFDTNRQLVLLAAEYEMLNTDSDAVMSSTIDEMGEDLFYQFLAMTYVKNDVAEIDMHKAAKYFEISCNLGNAESCYSLASIYFDGDLGDKDYSAARRYYKKAALLGECRAYMKLGVIYDNGVGVKQDFSMAAKYYEKAASFVGNGDKGCSEMHAACYSLAVMYEDGDGVKQDFSKAAQLYHKAIDYGNKIAYRNLALMYIYGKGVNANIDKAKELLEESCKLNDSLSCDFLRELKAQDTKIYDSEDAEKCLDLGLMYAYGEDGVEQNYFKAAELLRKACDRGNAGGCYNLGVLYEKGQGVKQNYVEAAKFFAKACEGGYTDGCYNLGLMYGRGQGVKQDYIEAKELFRKACDGGNVKGCKGYATLDKYI